jgi:hypothetical protein
LAEIVVSWAPPIACLDTLILLVSRGFQFSAGELYSNLPLRQGASGPKLFPGIQLLDDQHHPQAFCPTQTSLWVVHWLQTTVELLNLRVPS